jgi:hypothetical protein
MDLISTGSATALYAIALLLSPKRFDEIIMDFYQDAGIWIVIASCVAEYLLLITYIAVAAYEFFKNRKMMKKMNVKPRVYTPIHYVSSKSKSPRESPPNSNGSPLTQPSSNPPLSPNLSSTFFSSPSLIPKHPQGGRYKTRLTAMKRRHPQVYRGDRVENMPMNSTRTLIPSLNIETNTQH